MGWQLAASPFVRLGPWPNARRPGLRILAHAGQRADTATHPLARSAMRYFAPLAAALMAVSPAVAQQAPQRAFQLADWYRLTTLSAPAMSPSGDRVAVTVTTVRETEN